MFFFYKGGLFTIIYYFIDYIYLISIVSSFIYPFSSKSRPLKACAAYISTYSVILLKAQEVVWCHGGNKAFGDTHQLFLLKFSVLFPSINKDNKPTVLAELVRKSNKNVYMYEEVKWYPMHNRHSTDGSSCVSASYTEWFLLFAQGLSENPLP